MKATIKALRAATIIGMKYGVKLGDVLANETSPDGMYLELRADGYVWSAALKRWVMNSKTLAQQPVTELKRLPVKLRIMTEDAASGTVAEGYIADALIDAGFVIVHTSAVKQNTSGEGVRIYMEVEL